MRSFSAMRIFRNVGSRHLLPPRQAVLAAAAANRGAKIEILPPNLHNMLLLLLLLHNIV